MFTDYLPNIYNNNKKTFEDTKEVKRTKKNDGSQNTIQKTKHCIYLRTVVSSTIYASNIDGVL